MFAVARHFTVREAELAFKMFVFWSVRFLITGKGGGGLLDRNYALRAQDISTKKIKTAEELADAMIEIIPSDTVFEVAFAEARVSHAYRARYYLRALELKRKGLPAPELIPNEDQVVINLEHILPEKPQNNWPDIGHEIATAYYKRLGNMVLLQARKNSMLGNSPFSEKKIVLQDSAYLLTSDIAQNTSWGIEEISNRQKVLAKLAVETWPIKIQI
jgi:hypothetical protein